MRLIPDPGPLPDYDRSERAGTPARPSRDLEGRIIGVVEHELTVLTG